MPHLALPRAPMASGRWERQDGGSCLGHAASRGGDRAKRVWSMTQAGQGDCVPPVAWEDGVCPCWCPGEGTALQTAACPSTGFCRSSTQAQCFGSMLIGMGSHPCFLNKKYAHRLFVQGGMQRINVTALRAIQTSQAKRMLCPGDFFFCCFSSANEQGGSSALCSS